MLDRPLSMPAFIAGNCARMLIKLLAPNALPSELRHSTSHHVRCFRQLMTAILVPMVRRHPSVRASEY
jgi:hypothetical protein